MYYRMSVVFKPNLTYINYSCCVFVPVQFVAKND